ncbi:CFI-box-CTERM domain-containing protein [Microcoleus sp. B7-D4]|uniref:CFI-box-CTERM domain-containing protein n=3 Tax=Microcoleus TaxID=44471 RepID=UPI002FD1B306
MFNLNEGDYIYKDTTFKRLEDAKASCLEAKKYQKLGYYKKALEKYNFSLYSFENFFGFCALDSAALSPKTQVFLLLFVVDIVGQIKKCYTKLKEPYKLSVFLKIFEEIVKTIGENEKLLSAEQLIFYQKLKQEIELDADEIEFAEAKAFLEKSHQAIIDNSDDPIFREMVSYYEECCSYETFLVPSKGVIISSSSSSSCFIATAAYCTSAHPDIDTFRNFRDKKLLTNPVGQVLVSLYYKISPSVANYVKRQPVIKSFLRQQLERLAEWMRSREVKS